MPEQQPPLRQITEQKRARKAWQLVQGKLPEYGKRAQGFAVDIRTNGLLQTLATYNDGKPFEAELVNSLQQWLFSSECAFPWGTIHDTSLIERLCKCDSELYRKAQSEALAFVVWLKRFAKKE